MERLKVNRILLVDDMPSIHEDFRRILEPVRGPASLAAVERALFGTSTYSAAEFQLDCASSGEEGLRLVRGAILQRRPYALAFVDMRMPAGWDGIRTIEELWKEDPQLQVVICTAYSDHPLEESLARLGSPDRLLVLKKPFDPIEVSQLARALVAKRHLAIEAAAHLEVRENVLREIREMALELHRRNAEIDQLTEALSRDLHSTPALGRVTQLFSQKLRTARTDRFDDTIRGLRDSSRHTVQLVEGVLALTGIACADFAAEALDISKIAREEMAVLRDANKHRQVSASVQDGLRAWGDAHLVREALQELLKNAWKFTSRQDLAVVTVGAEQGPGGESVFFVRDSGCGFEVAKSSGLFRHIQRPHAPDEFAGAGVGLVAVGRIVDRHGGSIWMTSHPGQGASVYFTLPNPVVGIQQSRALDD
jgi:signal transduction histidine kinase